jgi:CDP-diacylglycerol--glycerol-3-phosphate 3-phosphatidyltransferase
MPPIVWPIALTFARLILGPAMVVVAWRHPDPAPWLAGGVVLGFLTDLFDGILARHLAVAGPALRRFDSQTDLVFWLCVVGCVFVARYDVGARNLGYILAMLALEAGTYGISFAKFGREACTHAYSAKAWAVLAVGVFVAVLGFGEEVYAFPVLFAAYLVSWLDVVAIVLILPAWRNDVPSAYHALLIRRGVGYRTWRFFH